MKDTKLTDIFMCKNRLLDDYAVDEALNVHSFHKIYVLIQGEIYVSKNSIRKLM